MSFILTCLFIYLLFMLLRPVFAWGVRKFIQHQARNIFGQAWGGQTYSSRTASTSERPGEKPRHRPRKKVFSRGDGEYVEFEEITVTRDDTEAKADTSQGYVREEQVSDAEWTEIK